MKKWILSFSLILALIASITWFQIGVSNGLTIAIDCPDGPFHGSLTIQKDASTHQTTASVREACANLFVELDKYERGEIIVVSLDVGNESAIELQIQEIQIESSNEGQYYVLLEITETEPFVAVGTL